MVIASAITDTFPPSGAKQFNSKVEVPRRSVVRFTRALVAFAALCTLQFPATPWPRATISRFDDGGSHIAKGSSTAEGYRTGSRFKASRGASRFPTLEAVAGLVPASRIFPTSTGRGSPTKVCWICSARQVQPGDIDKATAALTTMGGKDQRTSISR